MDGHPENEVLVDKADMTADRAFLSAELRIRQDPFAVGDEILQLTAQSLRIAISNLWATGKHGVMIRMLIRGYVFAICLLKRWLGLWWPDYAELGVRINDPRRLPTPNAWWGALEFRLIRLR
jgi:hypothetical protein